MNKKAIIIAPRALYVCAPAFDAEPDDEGWYGHVITCTEKLDGGWYKIVTPYRYETYAHKDDMLFDKAEIARREGEDTKLLRVWALAGDVHTEATHNGNVLITLYRGAIVEKIEDESLNADTMSAIDELMSGGGISCQSFDEYKRKINDKYFVNVASTGLFTDVSQKTDVNLKNTIVFLK